MNAFTIALKGIGQFQQEGRPQVLWVGVEANAALVALHRSIGTALADAIGFRPEERRYSPHITLARLNAPVPPQVIDGYLETIKGFEIPSVPIDRFVLYSSNYAENVPHYREETVFPLLEHASPSECASEEGRLGRLDDPRRTKALYDALVTDFMLYDFVAEWDAKVAALQLPYAIDTMNETYGSEFLFYLVFTHSLLPLDMDAVQVFYNRYYWFRRFMEEYQRVNGADAGLEHQAFQMLEQAPSDLDREMIPLIEAWAKPLGPSKKNPEVFWIDRVEKGRLGIMARPRGGDWLEGEIQSLAEAKVEVLVSLLATDEVAELELQDEERICEKCGVRFISFPIPDRGVPSSMPEAAQIVALIWDELRAGKKIAIHCRMGLGRSALIAACALTSQGTVVDEAFAMISRARGFSVPDTEEQREWVKGFAEFRDGHRAEGVS